MICAHRQTIHIGHPVFLRLVIEHWRPGQGVGIETVEWRGYSSAAVGKLADG